MSVSVPVQYVNQTTSKSLKVVVFTKPVRPDDLNSFSAAWLIAHAPPNGGTDEFTYSTEISTKAYHVEGPQTISTSLKQTQDGDTWKLMQKPGESPVLQKSKQQLS